MMWSPSPGRRRELWNDAAHMLHIGAKLTFEWTHPAVGRMIRPARARIGASALQHEPFHEAMKCGVVVPTRATEHQETLNGMRRPIRLHLNLNRANRGIQHHNLAQFVR